MPVALDLIAIEDSWVAEGIAESPAGSNHTRLGVEFGFDRVAWCAIAQTLAVGQAFGHELFRSAAVSQWIEAARNGVAGMELLEADAWIEAGMLVTYDYGPFHGKPKGNPANYHIAMVRDPGTQGKFQTDAGNEGDAMRQGWHNRADVSHFIRLPFDVAAPPSQGDLDMTPGQCRDHNPKLDAAGKPVLDDAGKPVLDPRKWFFMVDGGALMASVSGEPWFPIGGIWTSGVDAFCEPDTGLIVVAGRAADGRVQQALIYTDGNTLKPAGSAVEFYFISDHIFSAG